MPVRIGVKARDDYDREDPSTAVIAFVRDAATTDPAYVFPNLRSGPGLTDVEVIDDETAGVALVESGGSTLVVLGGATDTYTIRLTKRPTAAVDVAILTDGLTDVKTIDGVPVSLQEIGGYVPSRLFLGNLVVAGTTIVRGLGSELGSFLDEGFAPGQFVRVGIGSSTYDVEIAAGPGSVTAGSLTLASPLPLSGEFADATISRLNRRGLWTGPVQFDPVNNWLTRTACLTDASCAGWLADGFLEGHRIRITGGLNPGDYKIALIRGDNATFDSRLQLTLENPIATSGGEVVTVTRLAAVATFTPTNWYGHQAIELETDTFYSVPLPRQGVKFFPVSTHLVSKLRGPVSVEGGVTGADRSLRVGVKLPGEADAPLFGIGPQPPEGKAIDVLNIFDDSSQQDRSGTMTSTTLTGLGMAKDLSFPNSFFGEPTTFPGGISYGTISFVGGQFVTDGQKSTIEVVNLLLGLGNDRLDVQGTLDPATGEPDPTVSATGTVTITGTATGGTVTRPGFDWVAAGFVVGQLVLVSGLEGSWRLVGVSGGGSVLELRGAPLPTLAGVTRTVSVPGRHGGLTVVHGGGNFPLEISGPMTTTAGSVTRIDGLSWIASGYKVGDRIQIAGETGTRPVTGFATAACPYSDPFPGCGAASTMLLGGPAIGAGTATKKVHVAEPLKEQLAAAMDVATSSLIRRDGGAWTSAGLAPGQQVWISGLAGPWTIAGFGDSAFGAGTVLNLLGAALTPRANVTLTVFGYDPARDGGARVGGDTITVCSPSNPVPCGAVLGGPSSPLVVYGDTSQDGVWYSGDPSTTDGRDFGPKPFDPFTHLADDDNEDDEFFFALADPFDFHGNDVIDASALFAAVAAGALPTVGITAYGGRGNDLIVGSQAGDHLAGGSGDDTILGQRGVDHVYGDSGVNVNIVDRALTIPTESTSTYANADLLDAGRDVLYGDGAGTVAGGPQNAYDDVIFGDHGVVIQNVTDPNLPDPRLQKIQTTTLGSLRKIESRALQNGADDVILAGLGRDVVVGGAGHDMADGDEQDDFVFGDNAYLVRRINEATGATDVTSPHFQTLSAGLLYGRSDQAPSPSADASGQLLVDGVARNYRDPDGAPWWAEYLVTNLFHTFAFDQGAAGAASFGNDYLAGSQGHDVILGQLGDDVVQGDGGVELAFAGTSHAGASRTPDGCTGTVCDLVGDLDLVASFEATTDGEDYVEGGGGNDVIFGGLGQDDLVGGSSSFFSLTTPDRRPDGDDLVFGGAGTRAGRGDEALPTGTTVAERHARDADTVVGDNGNIVRIVGTGGIDGQGVVAPNLYVTFKYDNYGAMKIVVRGVTLLDYTAGGPAFDPAALANIGGDDEVHGESGDDTVYTGRGDDVLYGDADDDDLIGGWGHDWFSGGTGQD
ncbi:MAG: hypothetical protein LC708_00005, partial [Actinobacteria bacterium]|nr:hypothetical protein [Actinomycetota bacterium]